jgi:hypothetical protein
LRSFRRLEQEVQNARMKESKQATKEMKAMSGKPPSEEAKRDYMKWRKEQIKAHEQARQQHHTILEQQAMIRKQEHEKRMLFLESRKTKRPKVRRPKRSH